MHIKPSATRIVTILVAAIMILAGLYTLAVALTPAIIAPTISPTSTIGFPLHGGVEAWVCSIVAGAIQRGGARAKSLCARFAIVSFRPPCPDRLSF